MLTSRPLRQPVRIKIKSRIKIKNRTTTQSKRTKESPITSISVEQAQSELPKLISNLKAGETVVITEDGIPVARLSSEESRPRKRRQPGSAVGRLTILSEDEEHLNDFADYMP